MVFKKIVISFIFFIFAFLLVTSILPIPIFSAKDSSGKTEEKGAYVKITEPHDQDEVDKKLPLEVVVEFSTNSFTTDSNQKEHFTRNVKAVELLLNGKTYEIRRFDPPEKSGQVTFQVSFDNLPENSEETELKAIIYKTPNLKHILTESEPVTVLFGNFVGPEGGVVKGDEGIELIIPSGAFDTRTHVDIASNSIQQISLPPQEGLWFIGSAMLSLDGKQTQIPVDIAMPNRDDIDQGTVINDDQVLVTEEIEIEGERKLKLVDLAEAEDGRIISRLIFFPFTFPGIIKDGIYSFFTTLTSKYPKYAVGFVEGKVTDQNGNPIQSAVITISKLPLFADETNSEGEYLIPSVVGTFAVTAFDPKTGNFKTESAAVPQKGSGVTVNITLVPSDIPTNTTFTNGGFEDGLIGWAKEGRVEAIKGLGEGSDGVLGTADDVIKPKEGSSMAFVSTGEGSIGNASSALKQSFIIPPNAKTLTFEYNFVSEEFPEFNTSPKKSEQIAFEEVNSAQTTPVSGINFPGGDNTVEMTGWKKKTVDLTQFGNTGIATITITDLGDTIYDSVILLDNFKIQTGTGDAAFLRFPIDGHTAYTAPVTAILDHRSTGPYVRDKKVQVFTGEVAEGERYPSKETCVKGTPENDEDRKLCPKIGDIDRVPLFGYKRVTSATIDGISYNPPGGKQYMFYDGHPGYDYSFIKGILVYPAAPGTVKVDDNKFNQVNIFHDNGYVTTYLHLDTISKKTNDKVGENDVIGTVGSEGATGNHLHFEVLRNGKWIDPYGWNGLVGPSFTTSGVLWK